MNRFVRVDGCVHVVLAHDEEQLLCGTCTFDAADSEQDESLRWHETKATAVTCEICAKIINQCLSVAVGKTRPMKSYR